MVTKVEPNINSVEIHPQLSNDEHPVDDILAGAGSLWPILVCRFVKNILKKEFFLSQIPLFF